MRTNTSLITAVMLAGSVALLACADRQRSEVVDSAAHREPVRTALASPAAPLADSGSIDDDTGVVRASGPIVVAAFITTQAEADSDSDVNEALSDFQYYLPGMAKGLARRGVRMAVRFARPVRILVSGDTITWPVRADSGGVGYLFLTPGKRPMTRWGVNTDSGLLEDAASYFGPP
jgi:hypothetical protein